MIQQLEQEELDNNGFTAQQSSMGSKIVYDCMDPSPFYEHSKEEQFNEADAVDLGAVPDDSNESAS